MKNVFVVLLCFLMLPVAHAFSAPKKGPKLDVKTEHNFSDMLINGKYQYPDESLVKVDDDKLLTDLIGYRKNFKDRLGRSMSQE